jgi:hypothetical protein
MCPTLPKVCLRRDIPLPPVKAVERDAGWLNFGSKIVDKFALMAQEYKPSEIVRNRASTRLPTIRCMPTWRETTAQGPALPTCRHSKGVAFELAHAAIHLGEIEHLEEAHAPAQ